MQQLIGFAFFITASALAAAPSVDDVLANMTTAAEQFRGLKADLRWVTYTSLVDDTSAEKGSIVVRRTENKPTELLIHLTDPAEKFVLVEGTDVQIYNPKIALVEEYDLERSKDKLEQALLLGFGASGEVIREDYDVTLLGRETVGDQPTAYLELIPKSKEARASMPKLEMWVSEETWQPVQQKLYQGADGDYRLYAYSDIELNPKLRDSDLRLDLPKGVKRIQPR